MIRHFKLAIPYSVNTDLISFGEVPLLKLSFEFTGDFFSIPKYPCFDTGIALTVDISYTKKKSQFRQNKHQM